MPVSLPPSPFSYTYTPPHTAIVAATEVPESPPLIPLNVLSALTIDTAELKLDLLEDREGAKEEKETEDRDNRFDREHSFEGDTFGEREETRESTSPGARAGGLHSARHSDASDTFDTFRLYDRLRSLSRKSSLHWCGDLSAQLRSAADDTAANPFATHADRSVLGPVPLTPQDEHYEYHVRVATLCQKSDFASYFFGYVKLQAERPPGYTLTGCQWAFYFVSGLADDQIRELLLASAPLSLMDVFRQYHRLVIKRDIDRYLTTPLAE